MLKRLKQTWKDDEGIASRSASPSTTHAPEPMDITPQLTSVSLPNLHEPSMEEPTYPSTSGAPKRNRDAFEEPDAEPADLSMTSTVALERPVKQLKVSSSEALRNYLPEIVDSTEDMPYMSVVTHKDEILERAKAENLIADVPTMKISTSLLVEYLTWAIEQEEDRRLRLRAKSTRLRGRVVLIVVDDPTAMPKFVTAFEEGIPGVSIGQYADDSPKPEVEQWTELLKRDILMAPSSFILDSFLRGSLAITQFHTFILLDAQKIRNQDSHASLPVVQIMHDFYRVTDTGSRPRVLALLTPTADRRSHFDSKTLKLEQTLDAKVFGVSDDKRAQILALPDRPNEVVMVYDYSQRSAETRLLKALHGLDPNETVFRRYYHSSRGANREVGPCASDLVWRRSLKAIESELIADYDDVDEDDTDVPAVELMKIQMFNVIRNWAYAMPNLDPSSRGFNVSHKFVRLVQSLTTFKSYGEAFRGIIFVRKHVVASVLADLLRTLDDRLSFLRPQAVIGHGHQNDPNYFASIFQQFASGHCNLLIATKFIEDMDVPKASVVIRYDLFESQISQAYIRARTRGRESHLIYMVERGNDVHRRILSRITNLDKDMLQWTETLCNAPESSVPPQSFQETNNPYHSDSEPEDDETLTYIKDPTTSGRIYPQDATTVIYKYAKSIRKPASSFVPEKIFEFKDIHKDFGIVRAYVCLIHLPGSPIHKVSGDEFPTKAQARRAACYKACERLVYLGLLDCELVPLPDHLRAQYEYERVLALEKDDPYYDRTQKNITAPGTRAYPRNHPIFWDGALTTTSEVLYPTVVCVAETLEKTGAFAPMVILTKQPLPNLQGFRMFFAGVPVHATFHKALPIKIDEERLKMIHGFTLRVCRTIMNKALICSLESMVYFFLPLPRLWKPPKEERDIPDIEEDIPWDMVKLAAAQFAVPIKFATPEELEEDLTDAIMQDRWIEFTRRYRIVTIRRDLTPLSKPADSPREISFTSLFDFCKAKRKNCDTLADFNQPIVEVAKIHSIMNHLNPTAKPTADSGTPPKYLIPELCAKFTLPASTLWTAMLMPSVMRRVDEFLLVKELDARYFNHALREDLLHNAVCTPAAGYEYDYERLELLGDAFLKYLASIYVFVTNPSSTEGQLHVVRQRIISNKSLLMHSSRIGLPGYIQSKIFAFRVWHPPNFTLHTPTKAPKPAQAVEGDGETGVEAVTKSGEGSLDGEAGDDVDDIPEGVDKVAEVIAPEPTGAPDAAKASPAASMEDGEIDEDMLEDLTDMPQGAQDAVVTSAPTPAAAVPEPAPQVKIEEKIEEEIFSDVEAGESGTEDANPAEPEDSVPKPSDTPKDAPSKKKKKMRGKGKGKTKQKTKVDENSVQYLGDKAIADVAEAIIGAAYITGGRETALQATKALTIPLSNVDRWSDFGRKVLTPPPNILAKLKTSSVTAIESIIGHKFNRPHLLGQAMTHSSIQGYESTSYERLEFIGDAILDFMVIRHIYARDQSLSPGALTMLKGAMVSNSALAAVCVWSGLHDYLLFESPQLEHSIRAYCNELQICQQREYELAKEEGRMPGQYWLDKEPPKALSDLIESIIGAIYISEHFDPVGAEALFDNVLKPFFDQHITLHTLSHHPTKILFELFQEEGCQRFEITRARQGKEYECQVVVHEVVLADATDSSPTSAARFASMFALNALEGDPHFMKQTCSCKTQNPSKRMSKIKSDFEKALEAALAGDIPDSDDPEESPTSGP